MSDFDTNPLAGARLRHITRKEQTLAEQQTATWQEDDRLRQAREDRERGEWLTAEYCDRRRLSDYNAFRNSVERDDPAYVRLLIGLRGELVARSTHTPYTFTTTSDQHPDGPAVTIRGEREGEGDDTHGPRVALTDDVREAIFQQYVAATWDAAAVRRPPEPKPKPLTMEEKLAAMTAERERRAEARQKSGFTLGWRGW